MAVEGPGLLDHGFPDHHRRMAAINWAIAWLIIDEEGVTVYNLRAILDIDFMGLDSCVIAFWFGNRTFGKRKT